jgi:hemerythrin-like domain-containing protein
MIQIGAPAATLDTPVDHLMACHRRIEQRLDTLVSAADHLSIDRDRALQAIASSLRFLDSNGVMHTEDEESSLFPRLRPKLSAEEQAFVGALERQHSEAEAIYGELKRMIAQGIPDAGSYRDCALRLRALYRDHIRSEDEILTPIARRLLTDAETAEMSSEMRARRERA